MPFSVNNKLIPFPIDNDTKDMVVVNNTDYPFNSSLATDRLPLTKELPPSQLHPNSRQDEHSQPTHDNTKMMKTSPTNQIKQDQQLCDLDIGSTSSAAIPSIHQVMATPTDDNQLCDLPTCAPRLLLPPSPQAATIPVSFATQPIPTHKDFVLKTGRLLCAKSSVWYTSLQQRRLLRQSPGQEQRGVQRQETQLGWREFRAVLKPHCLELYLVSPLLLRGPRLAHTIYFSYRTKYNSKSRRSHQKVHRQHSRHSTVKLSLNSLPDYTIRLDYQNKTGGTSTFLLNAPTVSASQSWYMALYKQIPIKTLHTAYTSLSHDQQQQQQQQITSKKPIPPWLDIMIQNPANIYTDHTIFIRIPLDSIVKQDAFSVIQAKDVKQCVFKMCQNPNIQKGWNGRLMVPDMMSLCWRYGHRIEWIPDSASLICPQLIEKEHILELRSLSPQTGQVLETPVAMEGFLIQSSNTHNQFKHKHQSRIYALTDGHYLFMIDPSKAVLPNQQENQKRGWSLNWLSAATLMNLHPRRYGNGKQNNKLDRHRHFQSVPGFFTKPSSSQDTKSSFFFRHRKSPPDKGQRHDGVDDDPEQSAINVNDDDDDNGNQQEAARTADRIRRAGQVGYAYAVIDLSLVGRVQPVRMNKNNNNQSQPPSTAISRTATSILASPLSNEQQPFSTLISPSSTSSQLLQDEINKRQKRLFELVMNDGTRIQFEATSTQAMFEWVQRLRRCIHYGNECRSKGIVLSQAISSLWYQNTHKIILQSGILYVRKNTQKTYRRYLCVLSRNQGLLLYRYNQHGIMTRRRTIKISPTKDGKPTYVYALDQAAELRSNDAPTTMMTSDGIRTRDEIYQCAFVVWQRYSFSKNLWIMQIKEHLTFLKMGHRLGRKGHSFLFLASTVEEKEAWIWALQQELEH
ncbi:hypothetical protein BC941DRAFT_505853 [Chlamydoabsidia padenii]|nr:hypothetical protein BC941DRAFT_505853 [Chlamydoabsidia padenii]